MLVLVAFYKHPHFCMAKPLTCLLDMLTYMQQAWSRETKGPEKDSVITTKKQERKNKYSNAFRGTANALCLLGGE